MQNDEVVAMRYLTALFTFLALATSPAMAMDGIVSDTGDEVTVDDGTVFTEGSSISVFDADGTEHDLQIMRVADDADTTTVDLIDSETGDAQTIEFTK
ncbi:MAG: hypothetical protein M3O03_05490 [Pseudomonadota bacterium]|nr:hypothetical protein [Pseudomonadota bacterium]